MALLLRPATVGEILDGAFALYRRNFARFFAIAFLPLLPACMMWLAVAAIGRGSGPEPLTSLAQLSMWYTLLASLLVWGALTFAILHTEDGATAQVGEALGAGARRIPALVVASIVAFALMALGFLLLIVPGLIVAAMFFAYVPAIVHEGLGPFEALGRSRRLSKGARLRILGVFMLAWIIAALPSLAFGWIAGRAAGGGVFATLDPTAMGITGFALVQAGNAILGALTSPFSVCVMTLLYADRRARTEAPDLEAAADRLATAT